MALDNPESRVFHTMTHLISIHLQRALILASASPRRAELLRQIGLPFSVLPAYIAEPPPRPGQDVCAWAAEAATAKAMACAAALDHQHALVLGADTVVLHRVVAMPEAPTWEGMPVEVMGKPTDEADARRMLRALSGTTHTVVSALALLAHPEGTVNVEVVATEVTFRPLDDAEIAWYLATGEPFDKAGAYGIQGQGAVLVSALQGDYYTVVGLPLARLWAMIAPWRVFFPS